MIQTQLDRATTPKEALPPEVDQSRKQWLESLVPYLREIVEAEPPSAPPPKKRPVCPPPEDPAKPGKINMAFVAYVAHRAALKFLHKPQYFAEEAVNVWTGRGDDQDAWETKADALLGCESVAKIAILQNESIILSAHTNPGGLAYSIAKSAIRAEHRHQLGRLTIREIPARFPKMPRPKLIYSGWIERDGRRVPFYGYECRPSYDQLPRTVPGSSRTMGWPQYVEIMKIAPEPKNEEPAFVPGEISESEIPDTRPSPFELAWEASVYEALEYSREKLLTDLERNVFDLRFGARVVTFEEIGRRLGVSRRRACLAWKRVIHVFKEVLGLENLRYLKKGAAGLERKRPKRRQVASIYERGKCAELNSQQFPHPSVSDISSRKGFQGPGRSLPIA